MKQAIYSLIEKNDYKKSMEKLMLSYEQLKRSNYSVTSSKANSNERRDNADIIVLMYLFMALKSENLPDFKKISKQHFYNF